MEGKRYGINNSQAWSDPCPQAEEKGGKLGGHDYELVFGSDPERGYVNYRCKACGATTSVDSSD